MSTHTSKVEVDGARLTESCSHPSKFSVISATSSERTEHTVKASCVDRCLSPSSRKHGATRHQEQQTTQKRLRSPFLKNHFNATEPRSYQNTTPATNLTMAILYALVSVGKTVLAEYTATSGKSIPTNEDDSSFAENFHARSLPSCCQSCFCHCLLTLARFSIQQQVTFLPLPESFLQRFLHKMGR